VNIGSVTKTALIEALEGVCERKEVEFRSNYSGRGMYGKNCCGIVGSPSDLVKVVLAVVTETDPESAEDFTAVLEDNLCTDSMGYNTIFYWPSLDTKGTRWEEN
jgi:hypothetical protein